ncbi:hypothetical protein HOY82DRAFT_133996 [Tuber indicum]|nr:hypothetical protein HOY82DRAFT_133996 [Tuber indicum]
MNSTVICCIICGWKEGANGGWVNFRLSNHNMHLSEPFYLSTGHTARTEICLLLLHLLLLFQTTSTLSPSFCGKGVYQYWYEARLSSLIYPISFFLVCFADSFVSFLFLPLPRKHRFLAVSPFCSRRLQVLGVQRGPVPPLLPLFLTNFFICTVTSTSIHPPPHPTINNHLSFPRYGRNKTSTVPICRHTLDTRFKSFHHHHHHHHRQKV